MSDLRRYYNESDDYNTNEFRHSRTYDSGFSKESLFNSISVHSPGGGDNTKSKSSSRLLSVEQEKANREKRKLEKENNTLIDTIKKLEGMNDNLKKENMKLRANFEKSEYQKNGFSNMLQKLNDDCKQKNEQIKKHTEHIKKLESQLLMGSLHHNMYEENKRLKETLSTVEEDNREKSEKIIELSERLVKASHDLEMYKSAAEVNLLETNEQLDSQNKVTLDDLLSYLEGKSKLDTLRTEHFHLKNMLNEHNKTIENLNREVERQKSEIDGHQTEVAAYENALEASDKEVKTLQTQNQQLLEEERRLNKQVAALQEEVSKKDIQTGSEERKIKELTDKNERLLDDNKELKRKLEELDRQNDEFIQMNDNLENLVKELNDRLEISEKEKHEILENGNPEELQEELEMKDRALRERNGQIEQLVGKLKSVDRDIRELHNKNMKQEEAIVKYQEIIEFSQGFIQKMEQKFYAVLSEDQNSKKLKVEIHRLIESCIKRMLSNSG